MAAPEQIQSICRKHPLVFGSHDSQSNAAVKRRKVEVQLTEKVNETIEFEMLRKAGKSIPNTVQLDIGLGKRSLAALEESTTDQQDSGYPKGNRRSAITWEHVLFSLQFNADRLLRENSNKLKVSRLIQTLLCLS